MNKKSALYSSVKQYKAQVIAEALKETGNTRAAAKRLGIGYAYLLTLAKTLGVELPVYVPPAPPVYQGTTFRVGPSGRLYQVGRMGRVSPEQLLKMAAKRKPFRILSTKSGKDVTRVTLYRTILGSAS